MGRRGTASRKPTHSQSVGSRLRDAREQRGLSLRQIADTTRISVMSLEALERSDLSRLPGGIFTRSFVRAYAEQVGLDPDRAVQEFIAELPAEAASATARPTGVEDGEALESDRKVVTTAVGLILASLPIIGLAIYFGAYRSASAPADAASSPAEAPGVASETDVLPAQAVGPATPETTDVASGAAPQTWGLTMEIAPTASCWVSVTVDGVPAFAGWMSAGETRLIYARERILVNAGDAGAFAYTVNGRRGRALGATGEVASRSITLSNLREVLVP